MRIAFFLSGLAALAAQVLWARRLGVELGHEVLSLMATISAVFLGLLCGGWGHRIWKRAGRAEVNPGRIYARVEFGMCAGFLLTIVLMPLADWAVHFEYGSWPRWILTLVLPFLILLPATFPMGSTLPWMERWVEQVRREKDQAGWVIAWNTGGAALGGLMGVGLLLPWLGLRAGLMVCAVLSAVAGAVAWRHSSEAAGQKVVEKKPPRGTSAKTNATVDSHGGEDRTTVQKDRKRDLLRLAGCGFLGMSLEWVAMRALAQVYENSIYSFALILAVYLLASALGAWWLHARWKKVYRLLNVERLLWMNGLCVGMAAVTLMYVHPLAGWLRSLSAEGWWRGWGVEWILAWSVLGPSCMVMGMVYTRLLVTARRDDQGIAPGVVVNLWGCVAASPLVGIWILPRLGMAWTWAALAAGYFLLSLLKPGWIRGFSALAFLAGLCGLPQDLRLTLLPPQSQIVAQKQGVMGTVTVLESKDTGTSLRVNNRFQMGGTSALVPQRRQAHLPLLLHPAPRNALFLGPGTGITVGAASVHPGLHSDAVELVPEIVEMLPLFEPANRGVVRVPQVRFWKQDALSFVKTSDQRYDVIVADLFHPAQEGTAYLYSHEHFTALRARLAPGGLVCQWLPLHQLDWNAFLLVARTFQSVFSDTQVWLLHFNLEIPVVALIGRADRGTLDWKGIGERQQQVGLDELRSVGLNQPWMVAGCWVGDGGMLKEMVGKGALNTVDRPLLAFAGPAGILRLDRERSEGATLKRLLAGMKSAESWTRSDGAKGADETIQVLMRQYLRAREHYFSALDHEVQGRLEPAVEEHFAAVEESLYFAPAYARLVSLIQVMVPADRNRARSLYDRLLKVRPDQPLGRQLLEPLFQTEP